MTGLESLSEFRPRTVYVKVSTALFPELAEWSEPVRVRLERDLNDDTYELIVQRIGPKPGAWNPTWQELNNL